MWETVDDFAVQLKGAGFGIRIAFAEALSDELLVEKFQAVPAQAYALPIGTGVVLDFGSRPVSGELIESVLSKVVWPRGLNVLAWLTSDGASAARLGRAGLKNTEPVSEARAPAGVSIVERSLRSGQREEFDGDIVLVGQLNSGAELLAGRSVSVLGKLKGSVHAGRSGAEGAYVMAGSFESRQLRLGDRVCAQLGAGMKWWKKPVIITLEDGGFFFREWKLDAGSEAAPA
jgi:septum site-determining protein MinC